MAGTFREDFARIITLARTKLEQVEVTQEVDAERAILTLNGQRLPYRVSIKEAISSRGRRYAYYILAGDRVMLGLDNHPDRQALRLKYGGDFASHLAEFIPHRHSVDKLAIRLPNLGLQSSLSTGWRYLSLKLNKNWIDLIQIRE